MMTDKFLRKPQVSEITGLSPVTLWRLEREGRFPRRRQLSKNSVGYFESEVVDWMESRKPSGIEPVQVEEQPTSEVT